MTEPADGPTLPKPAGPHRFNPVMEDSSPSQIPPLRLGRWLMLFVIIGVLLRAFRYSLGLPLWGDEGFLGVNILDRTYRGLLQPLEYIQVAPIGFLWTQRAMAQCFGMSEYVMRLIPTLAGISAVILFAIWARLLVSPLASTLATAVLAVSDLSIRHAVELKPYAMDFLISLLFLIPATMFLTGRRDRWLAFLILFCPFGLVMSLPSVFVAAGIAATFCLLWREMKSRQRILLLIFVLVIAGTFLALVRIVIGKQFAGSGPDQLRSWIFPPLNPLRFVVWFVKAHTSNFFGYPLDLTMPGSAGSFLLLVVGVIALFRGRRRIIACLLISPFAMTMMAALLRRYPYGDSPRIGQHLVGPICLLIGLGAATIIQLLVKTQKGMRDTLLILFGILIAIGLVGAYATVFRHTTEVQRDYANRRFIRDLFGDAPPDATVAVLENGYKTKILTRWYLHEWPHRLVWDARIAELSKLMSGPLLIFNTRPDPELEDEITREMGSPPRHEYRFFGADEGMCEVFIYPNKAPG